MKDDDKPLASEFLGGHVLQVAEDMIGATYKAVEEASKYETVYKLMAERLEKLVKNLEAHALGQAWLTAGKGSRYAELATHARELAKVCRQYSGQCHAHANTLIATTEAFERNALVRKMVKKLAAKLEGKKQG